MSTTSRVGKIIPPPPNSKTKTKTRPQSNPVTTDDITIPSSSSSSSSAQERVFETKWRVRDAATKEGELGPNVSVAVQYAAFVNGFGERATQMWQEMDKKERERQLALFETVRTELGYVQDLAKVVSKAYNPLAMDGEILSGEELYAVFANISALYAIHTSFYDHVERIYADSPFAEGIGEALTSFAPSILVYSIYARGFTRGNALAVDLLASRAGFAELVGDELSLPSYLVKPIQRMCKYPLLIREIRKHTDDAHPDASLLDEAFAAFSLQLNQVNEVKRVAEAEEAIRSVLAVTSGGSSFDNLQLERRLAERRFVHFGLLDKITSPGSSADSPSVFQTRMFVLFNDLLVWLKTKGKPKNAKAVRYEFCKSAPLSACIVSDVPDRVDECPDLAHLFSIAVESTGKEYLLRAPDIEAKYVWISALFQAAEQQQHQVSVPDTSATTTTTTTTTTS